MLNMLLEIKRLLSKDTPKIVMEAFDNLLSTLRTQLCAESVAKKHAVKVKSR